MACSTTRLVPSRLGLGFFLMLERVGMAHSGTNGTEPSRSAIFKLTHYQFFHRVAHFFAHVVSGDFERSLSPDILATDALRSV